MDTNLWAYVRLQAIRIQELKREIAKGNKNKSKWWWNDEEEQYHQRAIQELKELTKRV